MNQNTLWRWNDEWGGNFNFQNIYSFLVLVKNLRQKKREMADKQPFYMGQGQNWTITSPENECELWWHDDLPFGTWCRAGGMSCTTFHTWRVWMMVITCTGFGGFKRRWWRGMSTFWATRAIWLCCMSFMALQIIIPILQISQ